MNLNYPPCLTKVGSLTFLLCYAANRSLFCLELLPISNEKYDNLQDLKKFCINPAAIEYYSDLPHKKIDKRSRAKSNKREVMDLEKQTKKSTPKKKSKISIPQKTNKK